MTRILHRQIGQSYPVAATAQGVMIRDGTGKEYIDASAGAAVDRDRLDGYVNAEALCKKCCAPRR
jgi:adenosylmethionine-8-amino-7-oxononanoate aminotransferase